MSFNSKSGNEVESFGGLGYNFAGNWVEYSNVNFGSGVSKVTFQFAVTAPYAGNKIVLRLDSPTGKIVGTLVTKATASWSTYTAQSTAITGATGVHKLYLCMVGNGPMGNIKSFVFA
jgi:hypothetical protein